MLTESREAMTRRKSSQIAAFASLSSPQFNANPFLAVAGTRSFCWLRPTSPARVAMAPAPRLWKSAEYSNQFCRMADLESVAFELKRDCAHLASRSRHAAGRAPHREGQAGTSS
jgi:hypothetical protein